MDQYDYLSEEHLKQACRDYGSRRVLRCDAARRASACRAATVIAAALLHLCGAMCPLEAQHTSGPTRRAAPDSVIVRVREGTALKFDVTPDGRTIIVDLLGQLWSLPVEGGKALPLTRAVRDTADDSDPSVSPDGAWVVFRSDRPRGRGLWLLSLANGTLQQLTDSALFGNDEHRTPAWAPDSRRIAYLRNGQVHVHDVLTGKGTKLRPDGLAPGSAFDPQWSRDGRRMLVGTGRPSRLVEIDLASNRAMPFDSDTTRVYAAVYSPDESRIAFFSTRDSSGAMQLCVRGRGEVSRVLVKHGHISNLRVRWSHDGRWLYYSADGKLLRVSPEGGTASEIPFEATLTFARPHYPERALRLPAPRTVLPARGFKGLAIAPDARRYALIALGKLWIGEIGHTPRAIIALSITARGLSWSPNGSEVAWSAGRGGTENLFALNVKTRITRQLTALRGTESLSSWSPDGRLIGFVHWAKPELAAPPWTPDTAGWRIRVIRANLSAPALLEDTRDLGPFDWSAFGHDRLSWNSTSSAILTFNTEGWPIGGRDSAKAVWRDLHGSTNVVAKFPARPSFVHAGRDGTITYVEDGLLWRMQLAGRGEPRLLSRRAALHPNIANDGTVLFASEPGLVLLRPDGSERPIGWAIKLNVAAAPAPLLVRNVRIFDGSGADPHGTRDILIEGGRISRITDLGRLAPRVGVAELDAAGRIAMPGLIDAHTHVPDPAVLQAALYFGVTTVREMGSSLALVAAERDELLAGITRGARLIVSGLRFYPSPRTGGLSGDTEWMPRDSAAMQRGLALLRSFGAEHVKMRIPKTFASGAMLVRLSRAQGFSISGHCANPLPLVVAGISGQEHLDGQCDERSVAMGYDDRFQLYRAAHLWGVPTIALHGAHARAVRDTSMAHDQQVEPFLTPQLRLDMLSDPPTGRLAMLRLRQGEEARSGTRQFHRAGLLIALGTDNSAFPDAVHTELAELVSAGMTPAEALVAATSAAARVVGIESDLGRIAIGKVADLVLLDADPLIDIRNSRRIWRVLQAGRVVDRDALRTIADRNE